MYRLQLYSCQGSVGSAAKDMHATPCTAACAGAKVALCELPRDFISSEDRGGTGGTCVLRGCVPKKLMAIAGLFNEEMQDAVGYGYALVCLFCISR